MRRLQISTLHQLLTNVTGKDEPKNRQGALIKSTAHTAKNPLSEKLPKQPHEWTQTRGNKW